MDKVFKCPDKSTDLEEEDEESKADGNSDVDYDDDEKRLLDEEGADKNVRKKTSAGKKKGKNQEQRNAAEMAQEIGSELSHVTLQDRYHWKRGSLPAIKFTGNAPSFKHASGISPEARFCCSASSTGATTTMTGGTMPKKPSDIDTSSSQVGSTVKNVSPKTKNAFNFNNHRKASKTPSITEEDESKADDHQPATDSKQNQNQEVVLPPIKPAGSPKTSSEVVPAVEPQSTSQSSVDSDGRQLSSSKVEIDIESVSSSA